MKSIESLGTPLSKKQQAQILGGKVYVTVTCKDQVGEWSYPAGFNTWAEAGAAMVEDCPRYCRSGKCSFSMSGSGPIM